MHDKALWTLIFSGTGVGLLVLVTYLTIRIRHHVKNIHAHATGVPKGDIGVIVEKMDKNQEAMRNHISSNHDELDGELRAINANTLATQRDLETDRKKRLSDEIIAELAKAKGKGKPRDDTH